MPTTNLTATVWRAIPVSGTGGTVSVTNPSASGPIYVWLFDAQGNVVLNGLKVQASSSNSFVVQSGGWSTAKMACGFTVSATWTVA